jgi:hypothetical protein
MMGSNGVDKPGQDQSESGTPETPDRRELIKRLGKAAMLPTLVASFLATDAEDAMAGS